MVRDFIRSRCLLWLAGTLVGVTAVGGGSWAGADEPRADELPGTEAMARQWLEIADVVLAKHVSPPTRQEMLKNTIQSILLQAGQQVPLGLAATISELGDTNQLREYLRATLETVLAESTLTPGELPAAVIRGLLAHVTGGQGLIPLEEFYVQQQIRDNQYVGIGIQLGMSDQYPTMVKVFPHGPAWKAGGRDGDQMISIEGIDAKAMPLTRVISLLRGQEGKPAALVVRRPEAPQETRELNMVRGVVPFDTVQGTKRDAEQHWIYLRQDDPRVAYLKLESIRGSTPAELRQVAGKLHAADCRALMLDLRGTQDGEVRYAVMVADLLLGAGPIGEVVDARGLHQFDSSADQLFSGWPLAVLVDGTTAGQAEWIAAAVRNQGRGKLVGSGTAARDAILELVELPGGIGGVRMITGKLLRGGGQPLAATDAPNNEQRLAGRFPMEMPGGASFRSRGMQPDVVAPRKEVAIALHWLQGQIEMRDF